MPAVTSARLLWVICSAPTHSMVRAIPARQAMTPCLSMMPADARPPSMRMASTARSASSRATRERPAHPGAAGTAPGTCRGTPRRSSGGPPPRRLSRPRQRGGVATRTTPVISPTGRTRASVGAASGKGFARAGACRRCSYTRCRAGAGGDRATGPAAADCGRAAACLVRAGCRVRIGRGDRDARRHRTPGRRSRRGTVADHRGWRRHDRQRPRGAGARGRRGPRSRRQASAHRRHPARVDTDRRRPRPPHPAPLPARRGGIRGVRRPRRRRRLGRPARLTCRKRPRRPRRAVRRRARAPSAPVAGGAARVVPGDVGQRTDLVRPGGARRGGGAFFARRCGSPALPGRRRRDQRRRGAGRHRWLAARRS